MSAPASNRLPLQPWIEDDRTRAVIAALTAGGSRVRFVGGCVRDALIGRAVRDIDLATPDPPATVIRLVVLPAVLVLLGERAWPGRRTPTAPPTPPASAAAPTEWHSVDGELVPVSR